MREGAGIGTVVGIGLAGALLVADGKAAGEHREADALITFLKIPIAIGVLVTSTSLGGFVGLGLGHRTVYRGAVSGPVSPPP